MDDQVMNQLLMGGGALAVGIYGVLAPYRWNVIRLRRSLARFFSQRTNELISKVIGGILILAGVLVLVASLAGVRFA